MDKIIEFFTDKSFLQNIFSALIGTGTALFVFYLTLKQERRREKEKLQRETDNRIRNFKNLITSSTSHAETTITNLGEMVNNYNTNLLDFQLLRFSPNKSFERLDELLKNETYFQSFTKKYGEKNIDNYNRISLIIDYFNMQLNQLWDIIQKGQNFDFERKTKFKDLSSQILNGIAKLIIKEDSGIAQKDNELLNHLILKFHEGLPSNNNLNYLYEFNRAVLENVLKNYIGNFSAMEIIERIRDSSILFDEIQKQNGAHKETLEGIQNEMSNSLERYRTEVKNLE
ncbi:hypothetical protein [Flavicella sp.]|uniref:hypothetical protein n=1 Tax=Flavicella sp. TaxID=2957742 RepID=UPI003017EF9F